MSDVKKVQTVLIELCDRKGSGFILDGTEGTKFEHELSCPSILFVPSTSYRYANVLIEGQAKGGTATERVLERIRYIANNPEISVAKQDKMGWLPSPKTDKIKLIWGALSVAREGSNVGMFDFLMQSVEFNESNPDKLPNSRAIYKTIDPDRVQEEQNEMDVESHNARSFVYTLQEQRGGVWVYQEDRINAICELFSIHASTMPTKVKMLSDHANEHSGDFLAKIKIFESEAAMVVGQSLALNVITIEKGVVMYVGKKKVIKNLASSDGTQDQKIEELGAYLRTKDGFEAYQELKAELELAKEFKGETK